MPVIPTTFGITLWISGHSRLLMQCPLYPQKRTLDGANEMSAKGQNDRAISARFIFSHDHSPPSSPKFIFEQEQGRTAESIVGLTCKSPSGNRTFVFCHCEPSKEFIC